VSWLVRNASIADAGPFTVVIELDGQVVQSHEVPGLDAGDMTGPPVSESDPMDFSHLALGMLTAGEHTVTVRIDGNNDVAEWYENNNTITRQFTVTEPPTQVTGQVWLDADADGLLDDGEAGIANVTVRLRGGFGGELLDETVTDDQGAYTLRVGAASEVSIEFVAPEHHVYTRQFGFGEERGSHARRGAGVSVTDIFTVGGGFGGSSAPVLAGLVPLRESAPWQNPVEAVDVDNDGLLSINDVLVVVRHLRDEGFGPLEGEPDSMHTFIDTTGDNVRGINDLLAVVTALRDSLVASAAEGEAHDGAYPLAPLWPSPGIHDRALAELFERDRTHA
jgi:hypothetical protein